MNNDKERLISIIREFYGRVVWSHKTHEKERELSTKRVKRDRWINVVLMAITTTGILISIPVGTVWTSLIAAFLGFISTGFALYQISFSPEAEMFHQRQAAKSLLIERDRLVLLLELAMSDSADLVSIRQKFTSVVERIGQIYGAAPDTTNESFRIATDGLKMNEELTFSVQELDLLLPESLRIGSIRTE